MSQLVNDLQAVKRVFIDYPKLCEEKRKDLETAGQERQDLLHVLELAKLNAIEMSKVMRDLKAVQLKRRQIKDELAILEEIKRFSQNKFKISHLENVISRVDYLVNRERSYRMRVRTDLQVLVEGEND